jgi:hypothetical protein
VGERHAGEPLGSQTPGQELVTGALAVDQEVIGAAADAAVPEVEEAAIDGARVGMEVVEGVDGGDAGPARGVQDERVPEVRAGEVDDVGRGGGGAGGGKRGEEGVEGEGAKGVEGEAGVPTGNRGTDGAGRRIAIQRRAPRCHQVHLVAERRHLVGQAGGVLVHAPGGGEKDVGQAHKRHLPRI